MEEQREEGIIPFEIKNGEYYTVENYYGFEVGIFISTGNTEDYPNGNKKGDIGYFIHAAMFACNRIFNPVILAGPDIDNHNGLSFPRDFHVRYANDKERNALDKRLKSRGYVWDSEKKEIRKSARKRKSK